MIGRWHEGLDVGIQSQRMPSGGGRPNDKMFGPFSPHEKNVRFSRDATAVIKCTVCALCNPQ
jgi:hypothetical protein